MSRHLPEDVLVRFVEGTLDEHQAVEAALHIDDCPFCAARAQEAEPLAAAFASMDDPPLPEGFEEAVLAAVERPHAARAVPQIPWLGIALILSAGLLMVVGGEPTALLWKLAAVARAAAVAISVVIRHLPSPATILPLMAVAALVCSLTTFRLLGLSRESS
jgi:anti-sigma factor RsiW